MEGQKEIIGALVKAQGELKNATFNKENPHFKSKYADLSAIREATVPVLSKHGLAISQTTEMVEGGLILKTSLWHTSGEGLHSEYPLPLNLDKPQAMGSAITYARRYCWAAICGISSDDDDDANAAQAEGGKAKKAAPKDIEKPHWKTEAERIKDGIDKCASRGNLDAYMKSEKKTLNTIKEHSETAYEFLIERSVKRHAGWPDEAAAAAE